MASADWYRTAIQQKSWDDLDQMWEQIIERNTPSWEPGKAFEYFILRAFQLGGAEVVFPYQVRLYGETVEQIDGVVYYETLACLIEAKDFSIQRKVNFEPIAKMRNQLMRRPAPTLGCVFSNSDFTEPALILANYVSPQTILLWQRHEIITSLKKRDFCSGLLVKYKKYIELGIADFNITSLDL